MYPFDDWMIFHPILWIYHILFINLSVDEYLDCLHFLVIMNNAAENIHV
jgi:hypothetical protein